MCCIIILSVLLFFVIVLLFAWNYNRSSGIVKTEIYESEENYAFIKYYNDNTLYFTIEAKDKSRTISFEARFTDENKAVFDEKQALPEGDAYYEFVFDDMIMYWYDNGDLIETYEKTGDDSGS